MKYNKGRPGGGLPRGTRAIQRVSYVSGAQLFTPGDRVVAKLLWGADISAVYLGCSASGAPVVGGVYAGWGGPTYMAREVRR